MTPLESDTVVKGLVESIRKKGTNLACPAAKYEPKSCKTARLSCFLSGFRTKRDMR